MEIDPAKTELLPTIELKPSLAVHSNTDEQEYAVVEDNQTGRFFRIGTSEEVFIRSLLAHGSANSAMAASGLNASQTQELCQWLETTGLARITQPASQAPPAPTPSPQEAQAHPEIGQAAIAAAIAAAQFAQPQGTYPSGDELGQKKDTSGPPPTSDQNEANLKAETGAASKPPSLLKKLGGTAFFARIPLCNPDAFIGKVVDQAGWAFSWKAAAFSVLLAALGMALMVGQWSEFLSLYRDLIASGRWLSLGIAWLGLKVVHELAHGATCKRYGGSVPKAGIALIMFMPIAFVDVTSSWRLDSRWKRIHVALAGVLAELFVAGVALLLWHYCPSLPVRQFLADIVVMATVTSALFNLNPLLKFDGYFVLADISGVQNLYDRAQKYARRWGARSILGIGELSSSQPRAGDELANWIKLYGIVASVWRMLTVFGLMVAAAAIFHGAGIVIALVGFCLFLLNPAATLLNYVCDQFRQGELAAGRLGVRLTLILAFCIGILFTTPAELQFSTPGIVEYDPPTLLRAPIDGFIEEVHVANGEQVKIGQPIVTLRNDDLQIELSNLRKELRSAEQAVRSARWRNDSSKLQESLSELVGVEQKLHEVKENVEDLIVRAPSAGQVVARQIHNVQGTYLEQGDEIAAIGNESKKRLKISLSQWEASQSEKWRERRVIVSVLGNWGWKATVSSLETRASDVPPDESLTVPAGGSLAVLAQGGKDALLCEPRVNAFIKLTPERSKQILCGQRCWISLPIWRKSIGHWLWEKALEKNPLSVEAFAMH